MHGRVRARIREKWRPPLALVIGGTLAAVLCMPLIGVGYFRVAGNVLGWGETTWMIGWIAVVSTAILGFLLWRLVLRPVYALTTYAKAVKEGRSDVPLPPHFGTPELSDLGVAVHEMATTLQNREAGIRAYSDHVTHEMKSPLTSIAAAAELLGGDIDEIGDRSHPDFYADSPNPIEHQYHLNRVLLCDAMTKAGFVQHPNEWWHFSYGDQVWAWQKQKAIAHYGRI